MKISNSFFFSGVFSNPFDVIKTRQQLQGELVSARGIKDLQLKTAQKKLPYKSIFQSIKSIIKAEGLRGLQKGLSSALAFQFCMNSIRLGTYQTVDNYGYNRQSNGELDPVLCLFFGGLSGIFGSTVACPLYMIKTQLQAQSHGTYAVGFQHGHKSTFDALKKILYESGVKGEINFNIIGSAKCIIISIIQDFGEVIVESYQEQRLDHRLS